MISVRQITKRIQRKQNPEIVETVRVGKKAPAWRKVIQRLASSRRKYASVNLQTIEGKTKEGDTVIIVGSVLGSGTLTKKVRVCALQFSETAREKITQQKGETVTLLEEIQKNPKAEGVTIIQ